tara:strand:+ start:1499 stop:2413 length:915 start_codon:yes stop_codon:yes gene_type:complete
MNLKQEKKLLNSVEQKTSFKDFFEINNFHIERFDRFYEHFSFIEGDIRLFKEGNSVDNNLYIEPKIKGKYCNRYIKKDVVSNLLKENVTAVFEALNEKDLFFFKIAKVVESLLKKRTWVNGYLTPSNSYGFGYHSDEHDVLILQILGSKKWQIKNDSEEIKEFKLLQNEYLYVPKGMIHKAITENDYSFHLTIGIAEDNEDSASDKIGLLEYQDVISNITAKSKFEVIKPFEIVSFEDNFIIKNISKEIKLPTWTYSFVMEINDHKTFSIEHSKSIIDYELKKKIIINLFKIGLLKTVPNNGYN